MTKTPGDFTQDRQTPQGEAMFYLKLKIEDQDTVIDYRSILECIDDHVLRNLMEDDKISACSIIGCDGRRIAGLPITTRQRLIDQLISNSAAIFSNRRKIKEF